MMDVAQLTEMLDNPMLSPTEVEMIEKRIMLLNRMKMNPESDQIMAPALGRAGIDSIPTGDMVPQQMAGGGIVAFQEGGKSGVDNIKSASQGRDSYRDQIEREVFDYMKRASTEDPFKESRAQDEEIRAQIAESKRISPYEALTMAGLRTMAGTSPQALVNLGAGGEEGLKAFGRSKREEADLQKQLLQQSGDREKAKFGRETQLQGQRLTALGQIYNRDAIIAAARAKGEDPELKNLYKAEALIARDPFIKGYLKLEETLTPGTPEYEDNQQRIIERQNNIYKALKVTSIKAEPSKIPPYVKPEEPSFFSRFNPFGSSKPAAPARTPGTMKFDKDGNPV
jgi:hypothetical protein